MKRLLALVGIIIAAALLGFVLWYGPWSAGWFSSKAWEFRDTKDNTVKNLEQRPLAPPR